MIGINLLSLVADRLEGECSNVVTVRSVRRRASHFSGATRCWCLVPAASQAVWQVPPLGRLGWSSCQAAMKKRSLPPVSGDDDDAEYEGPINVSADCNLLMANACDNKEVPGYKLPHDSSIRLHAILKPKPGEATTKAQ